MRPAKKGFTFIELIIYITILVILAGVFGLIPQNMFSLNSFITDSLTGQLEARQALQAMTKELRAASPSSTGSYALVQATSDSIVFYSDTNKDGVKERVRYFLSGSNLNKGVIAPTGNPGAYDPANETVSTQVVNIANSATPIFSYYDSNYNGTSPALSAPVNVSLVRLVKVTLIVDKNANKGPLAATFTTQISLRNLKDNL